MAALIHRSYNFASAARRCLYLWAPPAPPLSTVRIATSSHRYNQAYLLTSTPASRRDFTWGLLKEGWNCTVKLPKWLAITWWRYVLESAEADGAWPMVQSVEEP